MQLGFVIPLWADLTAVALGGVQGALFASGFRGQRRLDLLGVVVVGIVIGMGGGLIRDLLLGVAPATLQSDWYLITAVASSLLGMLLAPLLQWLNAVIVGLDAIVIGMFGAFGTSKALALGLPVVPAVFVGAIAAVGGGVLRDVLMALPVAVMHVGSLYAVAAAGGSAVLALLHALGVTLPVAAVVGIVVTCVVRLLAVVFDVSLPEQRDLYRRRVAAETGVIQVVRPPGNERAFMPVPGRPGYGRRMLGRPSRPGIATLLGGVLILFVSVIAQLATTDGLAEVLWVAVSIVGAIVIGIGIAVLVRHSARSHPPED